MPAIFLQRVCSCLPAICLLLLQVSVKSGSAAGSTSRSPRQPVALRCAPLTASHQRCWVAPVVGEPLPLQVSLLEWMGLAFNWPVLVHRWVARRAQGDVACVRACVRARGLSWLRV